VAEIGAIAAVARNGVIGAGGALPWRLPEDLRRFRRLTLGHVLVVGRKTFESHGLLPGRTLLVVTRDRAWTAPGVEVVNGVDEALDRARSLAPERTYVAGGGEIYRAAWDRLTHLEITEVDAEPEGEVRFPAIDPGRWRETGREPRDGFAFVSYARREVGGG